MKGYEKVELYRCKYCKEFHSDTTELVEKHLVECVANPDNKSCVMCKHIINKNAMEGGKPLKYYQCTNPKINKVLDDFDLYAMGAECFEERESTEMDYQNSKEYTEHLESKVNTIIDSMKSN